MDIPIEIIIADDWLKRLKEEEPEDDRVQPEVEV